MHAQKSTVRELTDVSELGELEPLWRALHRHHRSVSLFGGLLEDEAVSWSRRRAVYEGWLRAGEAIVLVADLPSARAAGYVVAHLCNVPDDTFAVSQRYAEVYTLSVAVERRGSGIGAALLDELDRRLAALGIHDLTVAVMVGNDDAQRFYRSRGFSPAEITHWRLRHDRAL